MMSDNLMPVTSDGPNITTQSGLQNILPGPSKVKTPRTGSRFQRIADKVSYGMGTPLNIAIWIVIVVVWILIFAFNLVNANGTFLPQWFTSTGFNFPLNLVTTVAELYIGFLVGASANRSERHLEDTLAQIEVLETKLGALLRENTDLTYKVKTDTDLLQDLHIQVSALTRMAGLSAGTSVPGDTSGVEAPSSARTQFINTHG
jgi:low affinity Fe/Cu permease